MNIVKANIRNAAEDVEAHRMTVAQAAKHYNVCESAITALLAYWESPVL